jgi:hypothetical protein
VPNGFAFDAWHTLSGTSTGMSFEYRIDGDLVFTQSTMTGSDLMSAMVQGYNYDLTTSYSVNWDNLNASAVPEPATSALTASLAVLGLAIWRRRRAATRIR